jgi:hypothetical protein
MRWMPSIRMSEMVPVVGDAAGRPGAGGPGAAAGDGADAGCGAPAGAGGPT